MTNTTNAENAQQHIDWALDWAADEDDGQKTRLADAILATAYAQLAIADAINANGATALAQQQLQHNAEQMRTYLDSVNPPEQFQRVELDEQLQQDISDEQITGLAATLWAAAPGNQSSPARRFQDDYAHRQDQYLAMARAALGLTDQPTQKDSRRP